MLINMGISILLFFITLVFVGVLLILIKFTLKQKHFKKFVNHFYTLLVFNGVIRVLVETYLELTLTAFVNIHIMRFDYIGEAIAAVLSISFSVIMIL